MGMRILNDPIVNTTAKFHFNANVKVIKEAVYKIQLIIENFQIHLWLYFLFLWFK